MIGSVITVEWSPSDDYDCHGRLGIGGICAFSLSIVILNYFLCAQASACLFVSNL